MIIRLLKFVAVILTAILLVACGKKGDPTLIAYQKPQSVICLPLYIKDNTVTLKWLYNAHDTLRVYKYIIEVSDDPKFLNAQPFTVDASTKDFVDNISSSGRYYRVKAVNQKQIQGEFCNAVGYSRLQTLPSVKDISANIKGDNAIIITWQPCHEPDITYKVYKSLSNGKIIKIFEVDKPMAIDTQQPLIDIYYVVSTVKKTDTAIFESAPSQPIATAKPIDLPDKVTGLKAFASNNAIFLSWEESANNFTKGYRLYRRQKDEAEFKYIGFSAIPSFVDSNVTTGQYSYFVTAVSERLQGEPSDIVDIKMQMNE